MYSFTWIRLRAYQSPSFVSPVAVVTTIQMLAPSLPGPRTLPAQTMLTCATISTKGSLVSAPPAPTDTSAANLDAPEPILERTTKICPIQDPSQSQLAALAIPPEVVPNYLSKLSPSTPIDIPLFPLTCMITLTKPTLTISLLVSLKGLDLVSKVHGPPKNILTSCLPGITPP